MAEVAVSIGNRGQRGPFRFGIAKGEGWRLTRRRRRDGGECFEIDARGDLLFLLVHLDERKVMGRGGPIEDQHSGEITGRLVGVELVHTFRRDTPVLRGTISANDDWIHASSLHQEATTWEDVDRARKRNAVTFHDRRDLALSSDSSRRISRHNANGIIVVVTHEQIACGGHAQRPRRVEKRSFQGAVQMPTLRPKAHGRGIEYRDGTLRDIDDFQQRGVAFRDEETVERIAGDAERRGERCLRQVSRAIA